MKNRSAPSALSTSSAHLAAIVSFERLAATLAIAAVATLAGCATSTAGYQESPTDRAFGDTVRQAQTRQTIDPDAAAKSAKAEAAGQTVQGDAQSARQAVGRYQDSFKAPPKTFNVLGVGGVAGGLSN